MKNGHMFPVLGSHVFPVPTIGKSLADPKMFAVESSACRGSISVGSLPASLGTATLGFSAPVETLKRLSSNKNDDSNT